MWFSEIICIIIQFQSVSIWVNMLHNIPHSTWNPEVRGALQKQGYLYQQQEYSIVGFFLD